MDDEQLRKHAEFEEEATKNVTGPMAISPNLLQQMKPKQHFFYVAWQDAEGRVIDIKHYDDYDTALMRAMNNAKVMGATYTIRDLSGRFIDGNFISQ